MKIIFEIVLSQYKRDIYKDVFRFKKSKNIIGLNYDAFRRFVKQEMCS